MSVLGFDSATLYPQKSHCTICLCIIVFRALFNMFKCISLLHILFRLSCILLCFTAGFHGSQSLVDAFIVISHRALVVCLARFPLETLKRNKLTP